MQLAATKRLRADFAGGMNPVSDMHYPDGGIQQYPKDLEVLIDSSCVCASCRPNLDSQPDMEPPVALVVSDHFEDLIAPLETLDFEAEQAGDTASVYANLDPSDKGLVRAYEKSVKNLAKVVGDLSASSDGALNELADDIQDALGLLTRKLKIMKGL